MKIRTRNWKYPLKDAIQCCYNCKVIPRVMHGNYYFIIEDIKGSEMKRLSATDDIKESVDCKDCKYREQCKTNNT